MVAFQDLAGIPTLEYKMNQESDVNDIQHCTGIEMNGQKFFRNIPGKTDKKGKHPGRRKLINWEKSTIENRGVPIYTDGSKIDSKVGFTFVVFLEGCLLHWNIWRLEDHFTVFQAAIYAVNEKFGYFKVSEFLYVDIYQ